LQLFFDSDVLLLVYYIEEFLQIMHLIPFVKFDAVTAYVCSCSMTNVAAARGHQAAEPDWAGVVAAAVVPSQCRSWWDVRHNEVDYNSVNVQYMTVYISAGECILW